MRGLVSFFAAGLLAFALVSAASAQEDFDKGKSGAQLFASDCAICHKTPQAVVKGGPPGEGFLRQHYSSSWQSAAAVAAYLRGIKAPASAERGSKPKSAKPSARGGAQPAGEKTKGNKEAKPAEAKPAAAETKPAEKPSDAKASEPKASEKKEPSKK